MSGRPHTVSSWSKAISRFADATRALASISIPRTPTRGRGSLPSTFPFHLGQHHIRVRKRESRWMCTLLPPLVILCQSCSIGLSATAVESIQQGKVRLPQVSSPNSWIFHLLNRCGLSWFRKPKPRFSRQYSVPDTSDLSTREFVDEGRAGPTHGTVSWF